MRLALAALALLSPAAQADIYRCVDAQGKTLYSDSPCARDSKSTSNITENVGVCASAQCEEVRRQQLEDARQRARSDKEELADMMNRRRQADADYERARQAELSYRRAIEERLAAMADQAAQSANNPYYYDYGWYPVYPVVGRPCGRTCNARPLPKGDVNDKPGAKAKHKEPSVSIRLDH